MGCSGCGHRYNPGAANPVVRRVSMRQGAVVGRYHLKKVVAPPPAPAAPAPSGAAAVPAPVVPITKSTK